MLRPILLVKIGLGGLVFAARWGQDGMQEHAEEAPSRSPESSFGAISSTS